MFWNLLPSHGDKLPWPGTQADFIKVIDLFTALRIFTVKDHTATSTEIAALFMNIFDTDISPYTDFQTMYTALQPHVNTGETATAMIKIIEADTLLDEVLEGTGVLPSERQQIERMISNYILHEFIDRMSKFVSFK